MFGPDLRGYSTLVSRIGRHQRHSYIGNTNAQRPMRPSSRWYGLCADTLAGALFTEGEVRAAEQKLK